MRKMCDVIDQLRLIRLAEQRFLGLWAVEQAIILPGLDRIAAAVYSAGAGNFDPQVNFGEQRDDK